MTAGAVGFTKPVVSWWKRVVSRFSLAKTGKRGPGSAASEGILWFCLAGLLVLPAVVPALTEDIGARAYDAATEHIYRGVVFSNALSQGALYPRWVQHLHLGLGSPFSLSNHHFLTTAWTYWPA